MGAGEIITNVFRTRKMIINSIMVVYEVLAEMTARLNEPQ